MAKLQPREKENGRNVSLSMACDIERSNSGNIDCLANVSPVLGNAPEKAMCGIRERVSIVRGGGSGIWTGAYRCTARGGRSKCNKPCSVANTHGVKELKEPHFSGKHTLQEKSESDGSE